MKETIVTDNTTHPEEDEKKKKTTKTTKAIGKTAAKSTTKTPRVKKTTTSKVTKTAKASTTKNTKAKVEKVAPKDENKITKKKTTTQAPEETAKVEAKNETTPKLTIKKSTAKVIVSGSENTVVRKVKRSTSDEKITNEETPRIVRKLKVGIPEDVSDNNEVQKIIEKPEIKEEVKIEENSSTLSTSDVSTRVPRPRRQLSPKSIQKIKRISQKQAEQEARIKSRNEAQHNKLKEKELKKEQQIIRQEEQKRLREENAIKRQELQKQKAIEKEIALKEKNEKDRLAKIAKEQEKKVYRPTPTPKAKNSKPAYNFNPDYVRVKSENNVAGRNIRFLVVFFLITIAVIVVICVSATKAFRSDKPSKELLTENVTENMLKTDISGVYEIEQLRTADSEYIDIDLNDRYIITKSKKEDSTMLRVFDLYTRQFTYETVLDNINAKVGLFKNNSFYVGNNTPNIIEVLDTNGKLLNKYENISNYSTLIPDETNSLWTISNDKLLKLHDNKVNVIDIDIRGINPKVCYISDNKVYYTYFSTKNEYASYDISNSICSNYITLSGYELQNNLILNINNNKTKTSFTSNGLDINSMDYVFKSLYDSNTNIYGIIDNDIEVIDKTYNTSGILTLPETTPLQISTNNDSMIFSAKSNSEYKIYYVENPELNYEIANISTKNVSDTLKVNIEKSNEIYNKYGILVHPVPLEKNYISTNETYSIKSSTSDEEVSEFMDKLTEKLDTYPQNFIKKLRTGNVKNIEIYLGSDIEGVSESSLSYATAITSRNYNSICIAINVNYLDDIDRILAHEFFHVIENSIVMNNPDKEVFASWKNLNPNGFNYYNTFEVTARDGSYTFSNETNPSNIWFIDSYAKTNEKEDRARIFENMVMQKNFVFGINTLYSKANYLSNIIQEYLPELYDNDTPIWDNYRQ